MQSPIDTETLAARTAAKLAQPGRASGPGAPTGEFGALALATLQAANGLWMTTAEITEVIGTKLGAQNAQKYLERLVTAGQVERAQSHTRGRHWWRAVTPASEEVGT